MTNFVKIFSFIGVFIHHIVSRSVKNFTKGILVFNHAAFKLRPPMKRKFSILFYLPVFLFFTSCKALKSLSAKDDTAYTTSKDAKQNTDPQFLDDIQVSPGGKRGTLSAPVAKPVAKSPRQLKEEDGDMLLANNLQMKYASLLNVDAAHLPALPLLREVEIWWGTKYCMGGTTESCIDCSALTQTILADVYGVSVPRTAQAQYDNCQMVLGDDSLQPGDLVFFHTTRRGISHVGLYLANNKFVHASTSQGVMISDLGDAYWKERYRGAGRYINN